MASFGNASGAGAAVRARHPGRQGLALRHAPDAVHAHRHARERRRRWPTTCSPSSTSGKVKIRIDQRYPLAQVRRRTATSRRARRPAAPSSRCERRFRPAGAAATGAGGVPSERGEAAFLQTAVASPLAARPCGVATVRRSAGRWPGLPWRTSHDSFAPTSSTTVRRSGTT